MEEKEAEFDDISKWEEIQPRMLSPMRFQDKVFEHGIRLERGYQETEKCYG